jgi:hypothetical protein
MQRPACQVFARAVVRLLDRAFCHDWSCHARGQIERPPENQQPAALYVGLALRWLFFRIGLNFEARTPSLCFASMQIIPLR